MDKAKLNPNFILQIGILVKDIEEAAKNWAEFLGVEVPNVRLNNPYEITQATFRGDPCPARLKQAIFEFDNIQIELITPADEKPSFWRECLERDGEGVHHLAFSGRDPKKLAELMGSKGMPMVQRGEYQNGRYTYYDTFDKLKVYLETLEFDPMTQDEFENENPLQLIRKIRKKK